MSWAIREIAREQYKLMPNGTIRQDANGAWSLDYIKGNFMGNAKAGTPTAYAYARIAPQEAGTLEPDFGFGPLPADAELVHCAGWADRRLIVLFHRGNPDISSSLMLAVGPQVPETWFAANAPQAPSDGTGGAGPPPPPETLGGQVLARLDALPDVLADTLLAPNETDEGRAAYKLPLTFGNRLQNHVAFVVHALLTNDAVVREVVAALDRATAPEIP